MVDLVARCGEIPQSDAVGTALGEPSSVGTEARGSGSNSGEIPDWLPIRNIVESDEIRASHRK